MNSIRLVPRAWGETASRAFSGEGGLLASGRWHSKGHPIIYSASTLPLAVLERLAHLKRSVGIVEHLYYEIAVPDELIETPRTLPAGWDMEPPGPASQDFGSRWLREERSAGLCVPSVVVPSHRNLIVNPRHPKFTLKWVLSGPHPFRFDPRLAGDA